MTDAQAVSLGKRLRQERESHHWTQEELAEKIRGSVPSINRWENGKATPRPGLLTLLIEVFGRSPERWIRFPAPPGRVPDRLPAP